MRITKIELLTIFSIVTPYIIALFLFRQVSIPHFLGLLRFSALFLIVSLIALLIKRQTKYKKVYYFLTGFITVTIFFTYKEEIINTSNKIFFLVHKSKMLETVALIQTAQRENKQMGNLELSFATVDTLESGEIIFTLDGMLDNCIGIAYSEDNTNPGYTNCGNIIEWKKLDDHWYLWQTT